MRHYLTAIVLAIEAAAIAVAGLAAITVPTVLIWVVTFSLNAEPLTIVKIIASVWALSHGIPLTIDLTAQASLNFGLAAEELTFTLSLIPLSLSLLTVWLAARVGARFRADARGGAIALFGGTVGFAAAALMILFTAHDSVQWPIGLSTSAATAWFAAPAWTMYFIHHSDLLARGWHRIAAQLTRVGAPHLRWNFSHLIPRILRLCVAAGAAVIFIAAVAFASTLLASYPEIIRLSQELQLDLVGVLALFILQLIYLPTFIIWALSWLSGAGFALGSGSSITSFEVLLGPVPALPVVGSIPDAWQNLGFLSILLIVLVAFTVGILFGGLPEYKNPTLPAVVGIAAAAVAVLSVGVALLGFLSGGSIGPGRMVETGPSVWWFTASVGAEVFIGLLAGLTVRRIPLPTRSLRRTQNDTLNNLHDKQQKRPSVQPAPPLNQSTAVLNVTKHDDSGDRGSLETEKSRIADPVIERQQSWFRRPTRKAKPQLDFTEESLLEKYSWDSDADRDTETDTQL